MQYLWNGFPFEGSLSSNKIYAFHFYDLNISIKESLAEFRKGVQVGCSPPGKIFLEKISKGGLKEIFWTKFRNVSQKSLLWSPLWGFNRFSAKIFNKNCDFCWKKNFKQNFGDVAENCPLNPMSLTPPEIWKFFELASPWREVPCETLVFIIFSN